MDLLLHKVTHFSCLGLDSLREVWLDFKQLVIGCTENADFLQGLKTTFQN